MSGDQWARLGGGAAATYDAVLEPGMFRPWGDVLVRAGSVAIGDRVLDVATGTGVVARAAASRGARVTGLDFSHDMLERARVRPDSVGLDWVEASADAMPFDDGEFDVVLCAHGLQQFPDAPAAVAEARRVLRTGGRVAACVWAEIEGNPAMHALVRGLAARVGAEAADNRRVPFSLGDADRLLAVLERGGLDEVQVRTQTALTDFASTDSFIDAQIAATPLAATGGVDAEARALLGADVHAALGTAPGEPLTVPMTALVATGVAR